MATVCLLSFRLGLTDGVSIVAARWATALRSLGFDMVTVAGEGPVDRVVPGLAIDDAHPPRREDLDAALAGADLVVVENLLTIPMRLDASLVVAGVLRGRPAVLHHHDPPWQRERYAHVTELPVDDPSWRHAVINDLTRRQFAERGIEATVVWPCVDVDPPPGDRAGTRRRLGVGDAERLLLHPVRAIARKDVPRAIALAEQVGATYWLTGPAEEGYGPTLDRLLAGARCPVIHAPMPTPADAYAACDAVLFPSTWEGFGLPPLEASARRRPVVVGRYPVAEELRALGFVWLPHDDAGPLDRALREVDAAALDTNEAIVRRCFSPEALRDSLARLLADAGWRP